jgi:hypothetical protein
VLQPLDKGDLTTSYASDSSSLIRQWEKGGFPLNTLICCIEVPSKAALTAHKMENFINSIFCIENSSESVGWNLLKC